MDKRITIRDVAVKAGYSTATVSLALRDSTHLPEATREVIRRVAEEMGYRPDPLLASIAANRWQGHPSGMHSTMAALSDHEIEGWDGLSQRAHRLGYHIDRYRIQDYPNPATLSTLLYNRGVLGILVGQIFTPRFCERFDWSHFSSVAISEGAFRPPIHLVMPNHFHAVQQAWDYARAQGCRRIGLAVFDIPEALDYHERCAAFQERQTTVPHTQRIPVLSVPPGISGVAKSPFKEAVPLLAAWVEQYHPDAVLGFNQVFYWAMREVTQRATEHVLFVSLWKQQEDLDCPGLLFPVHEIGARAVDWVDSLLRTGERGLPKYPATMQIEMRWVAATTSP